MRRTASGGRDPYGPARRQTGLHPADRSLMASTLAAALAQLEGAEFDRIVYSGPEVRRRPPDRALEAAFAGFSYRGLLNEIRQLARSRRCDLADAEEAVQEELVVLMERRRWLFHES